MTARRRDSFTAGRRHRQILKRIACAGTAMDGRKCVGRCMNDAPLRASAAGARYEHRYDHESHSPGSRLSRHRQPVPGGMRASAICGSVLEPVPVLTSLVQINASARRAAGGGTAHTGPRGWRRRRRPIRKCRHAKAGRWQDAAQPDRAGRATTTRTAGPAGSGGGSPAGQSLAVPKGRMHFEPFTVSGCPDQEIRNADLRGEER